MSASKLRSSKKLEVEIQGSRVSLHVCLSDLKPPLWSILEAAPEGSGVTALPSPWGCLLK